MKPANTNTEPLYSFTPAEFRRLWAAREAIRVGYYNDGGPVTEWVLDEQWLRTGVAR